MYAEAIVISSVLNTNALFEVRVSFAKSKAVDLTWPVTSVCRVHEEGKIFKRASYPLEI
jgi:hypothetical protein